MQNHRDDFSREKSQESERLCQLIGLLVTPLGVLVPSLANFCHPLLVYLAYATESLAGNESRRAGVASTALTSHGLWYLPVVRSCAYAFSSCIHSPMTVCVPYHVSTYVLPSKLMKTLS